MTPPFDGRYYKEFLAGWGTMDVNGHMANTAYLDLAADVRMAFFAEHGSRRSNPPHRTRAGDAERTSPVLPRGGLHETATVPMPFWQ